MSCNAGFSEFARVVDINDRSNRIGDVVVLLQLLIETAQVNDDHATGGDSAGGIPGSAWDDELAGSGDSILKPGSRGMSEASDVFVRYVIGSTWINALLGEMRVVLETNLHLVASAGMANKYDETGSACTKLDDLGDILQSVAGILVLVSSGRTSSSDADLVQRVSEWAADNKIMEMSLSILAHLDAFLKKDNKALPPDFSPKTSGLVELGANFRPSDAQRPNALDTSTDSMSQDGSNLTLPTPQTSFDETRFRKKREFLVVIGNLAAGNKTLQDTARHFEVRMRSYSPLPSKLNAENEDGYFKTSAPASVNSRTFAPDTSGTLGEAEKSVEWVLTSGLVLVLSLTQIDNHHPFIREHAILTIKLLLENNPENQKLVEGMEKV
ncbi:Copper transport protein 86 [Smittium culicis]|uniref:Ataxin-10 homolog n=1 Tax=Smittium culicis TaxID=133412 RepID=A0A1R1YMB4_9FUNG|nr:Copper transport protein 86 [Smittium culicis]